MLFKLSKSNVHSLTSVYKYCHSLENLPYHSLKAYHFQECIDQCQRSYATQSAIKNLFRHLDRFALELDIINKSYHPLLTTDSIPEGNKAVFTQQERNLIWEKRNIDWMDSLLVFLYTGFRISELLELKKEQVNLENETLTGGKKTKAGKNRIIPIHSKILPLITQRMKMDGEFLFTMNGEQCTDSQYRTVWKRLMKELNMEHTPHECRHTFRSLLDSAGANPVCIDRLMGHKSLGVGERIYTHKSIEELKENIELVST
ncbi:MAG: tyrosine-type recombinase/integrase [Eubacteriales bacterium]